MVYLSIIFYIRQVKAAEEDNVNAKSESVETRKTLEQVTKEESELASKVRQMLILQRWDGCHHHVYIIFSPPNKVKFIL